MSKRKLTKNSILRGESYISAYTGKTIDAKSTGPDCKCSLKCFSRISECSRIKILSDFLQLESKNTQDIHLQGLIEKKKINQKRPREGELHKPKSATFKYFVLSGDERLSVCKKAFISFYSLSNKRVYRLSKLLQNGKSPLDTRGKNANPNKTSVDVLGLIHDHISSFPTKESHYSNKIIQYLDARLNIKIMFNLFIEKYPNVNVKYDFYRKYFTENFKIRFGRPQIDVCSQCEELDTKIKSPFLCETAKLAAKAELVIHKRRASKFYKAMREAKEICLKNNNVCAIAFDYMQNLPLPAIPVQEIFYMRQLWLNVFCIHDLKNDESVLFVYHEGQAKKGANEVASFLYTYVNEFLSNDITELFLFSDSCPGQNRNHTVLRLCSGLVATKRFNKITYKFPVRGHSFLACDRDFGVFKRQIKKTDRIYTPREYIEILCNAKTSRTLVKLIDSGDILNFDRWWPTYFKKTVNSLESSNSETPRSQRQGFTPNSFKEYNFSSENPGVIRARPFIDSLVIHTFNLGKSTIHNLLLNPARAYGVNNGVPINDHKLEDLKKLQKYIQGEEAVEFYKNILQWNTTMDTD